MYQEIRQQVLSILLFISSHVTYAISISWLLKGLAGRFRVKVKVMYFNKAFVELNRRVQGSCIISDEERGLTI